MATPYALIIEQRAQSAGEFGKMIRRWRERNGWTQYTAKSWAQEAGFALIGHSGVSELENGITKAPGIKVFLHLAEVNERVAARNYVGIRSRKLRDEIEGSMAIVDEQGQPWGPAMFWECFTGLRAIPEWLQADPGENRPVITDAGAAELSAQWAAAARDAIRAAGMRSSELTSAGQAAPVSRRPRWTDVVMGFEPYTAAELAELWDAQAATWLPATWLQRWIDAISPAPSGGGGGGANRSSDLTASDALQIGLPTL